MEFKWTVKLTKYHSVVLIDNNNNNQENLPIYLNMFVMTYNAVIYADKLNKSTISSQVIHWMETQIMPFPMWMEANQWQDSSN